MAARAEVGVRPHRRKGGARCTPPDPCWAELRAGWGAFLAELTGERMPAHAPLSGTLELDRAGIVTSYSPADDAPASPHEVIGRDYFAEFAPLEAQAFRAEYAGFLDGVDLARRFNTPTGKVTFLRVNRNCALVLCHVQAEVKGGAP
jgi:hypothetical protein